jgi:cytochrome c5
MSNFQRVGRRASFTTTAELTAAVLALALLAPWQQTQAQSGERRGQQVVEETCASCHVPGTMGAPKIGDNDAWAERAALGLSSLTQHAIDGIRKMPAHGGNPSITDLEISRAITYMVNRSGGQWIEPASRADLLAERNGEQVVQAQCTKCHQTGVGGAPKIGDRAAWAPRLKQGLNLLVRSAIKGHGGMPARGGMADLTDSEMRNAVSYMFDPESVHRSAAAPAPAPVRDANRMTVEGVEILLGIQSAEALRALPKGSAESTMHKGVPRGAGNYHVNVSLFNSTSHDPISDAQVEVRVEALGMGGETKKLELMKINNITSYGNYFQMAGEGPYWVIVRVQRPGSSGWLEARFQH